MTVVISLSVIEACHFGLVKSGVWMAEKPLPSTPLHIEHFDLKSCAASVAAKAGPPKTRLTATNISTTKIRKGVFIVVSEPQLWCSGCVQAPGTTHDKHLPHTAIPAPARFLKCSIRKASSP